MHQIFNYIAIDLMSPLNAINQTSRIYERINELTFFPQRNKEIDVPKQKREYRKMLVDNYCILYSIDDDMVFIEDIYFKSSDIENKINRLLKRILWGGQFRGSHAPYGSKEMQGNATPAKESF